MMKKNEKKGKMKLFSSSYFNFFCLIPLFPTKQKSNKNKTLVDNFFLPPNENLFLQTKQQNTKHQ